MPTFVNVTVVFNNKDSVAHNFSVYEDKAATKPFFVGESASPFQTVNYQFVAPSSPGTYYFRCDTQPNTMNGSFIVQGTKT